MEITRVITSWRDESINWSELICCLSAVWMIKQRRRHVKNNAGILQPGLKSRPRRVTAIASNSFIMDSVTERNINIVCFFRLISPVQVCYLLSQPAGLIQHDDVGSSRPNITSHDQPLTSQLQSRPAGLLIGGRGRLSSESQKGFGNLEGDWTKLPSNTF